MPKPQSHHTHSDRRATSNDRRNAKNTQTQTQSRHPTRTQPDRHALPAQAQTRDLQTNTRGQRYKVEAQTSLLDFLKLKLASQSLTSIKALLKHGCIRIGQTAVTQFDAPLIPGDEIEILTAQQARFALTDTRLSILFEDAHLLVVHKASGLHSADTTGKGVDNAASILEAYLRKRAPNKRIYIVHRLDRDTSGVMIFAKSREAQDRLVKSWNQSVLKREYIALAEGTFEQQDGTIDSYLYEDDRKVMHCTDDPRKGLRAITHFHVLSANSDYSLVRLELDTGRTNQIRVHLQSRHHPVAGDAKYGAATDPIGRLALHAQNITFKHPITHEVLSFQVDAPFSLY
ncbi:MAG: RluA family pseudouridine synthase [Proteobacteria bacterium]|nr:RluA family pseudouridine synthase [Pseudomonadota bacterium]